MTRKVIEALEDVRMNGGTLEVLADALADALQLPPDEVEWLRSQRLAETKDDTHARARADSQLLKELGVPEGLQVVALQEKHYGGFHVAFTARIVSGNIGKHILDNAAAREAWIRADPERLAKYLTTLRQIYLT